MKRNSKIFVGLAIFLFCCAFSFKFTFGRDASFEFMWVDMLTLLMAFLASAVVMIILMQKAKKEESFEEELELKEWNKSSLYKYDRDEFV